MTTDFEQQILALASGSPTSTGAPPLRYTANGEAYEWNGQEWVRAPQWDRPVSEAGPARPQGAVNRAELEAAGATFGPGYARTGDGAEYRQNADGTYSLSKMPDAGARPTQVTNKAIQALAGMKPTATLTAQAHTGQALQPAPLSHLGSPYFTDADVGLAAETPGVQAADLLGAIPASFAPPDVPTLPILAGGIYGAGPGAGAGYMPASGLFSDTGMHPYQAAFQGEYGDTSIGVGFNVPEILAGAGYAPTGDPARDLQAALEIMRERERLLNDPLTHAKAKAMGTTPQAAAQSRLEMGNLIGPYMPGKTHFNTGWDPTKWQSWADWAAGKPPDNYGKASWSNTPDEPHFQSPLQLYGMASGGAINTGGTPYLIQPLGGAGPAAVVSEFGTNPETIKWNDQVITVTPEPWRPPTPPWASGGQGPVVNLPQLPPPAVIEPPEPWRPPTQPWTDEQGNLHVPPGWSHGAYMTVDYTPPVQPWRYSHLARRGPYHEGREAITRLGTDARYLRLLRRHGLPTPPWAAARTPAAAPTEVEEDGVVGMATGGQVMTGGQPYMVAPAFGAGPAAVVGSPLGQETQVLATLVNLIMNKGRRRRGPYQARPLGMA